jgi:hypothetical protein
MVEGAEHLSRLHSLPSFVRSTPTVKYRSIYKRRGRSTGQTGLAFIDHQGDLRYGT